MYPFQTACRVIFSIIGVTYMAYISGKSAVSAADRIATKLHHFQLRNSRYDRLKSRSFMLLKNIIFKASFKSLSGIHFK